MQLSQLPVYTMTSIWGRIDLLGASSTQGLVRLLQLDADTLLYSLSTTKTNTGGMRREKPLRGPAAQALASWLAVAPATEGPLAVLRQQGQRRAK